MNQNPSFCQPSLPEYVAHLWRRGWVIAIVVVLASLGVWAGVSDRGPGSFRATAQILVRPRPAAPEAGRGAEPLPAPAFESLFLADDTLAAVRDGYRQRAQTDPALPAINDAPDVLRSFFSTSVDTTVDTTVYTQFSPLIELSATAGDAAQARALVDAWAEVVMARFGNLLEDEAAATRGRLAQEVERLCAERFTVALERHGIERRAYRLQATANDNELRAAPSSAGPPPQFPRFRADKTSGDESPSAPIRDADFPRQRPPSLADLSRELRQQRASLTDEAAREALDLKRQILAAEITDTMRLVDEQEPELAKLWAELFGLDAKLAQIDARLDSLLAAMSDASLGVAGSTSPNEGGTLRLIAKAQTPDVAMPPGWSAVPLLAAFVAIAGTIVLLLGELYLRRALGATRGD